MPNIVAELRWYGSKDASQPKQTIPTVEQLIASGAQETGDTIMDLSRYNKERDSLPEGRDPRIFNLVHHEYDVDLTYVPDREGFYLENFSGTKWRPQDFDECMTLLEEIGFQMDRYGELI